MSKIYDLGLHQSYVASITNVETGKEKQFEITRVSGGWIYSDLELMISTFVPLSEESKEGKYSQPMNEKDIYI